MHWLCACEERSGDALGKRMGRRAWLRVEGGQTCMSLIANAQRMLVKRCEDDVDS